MQMPSQIVQIGYLGAGMLALGTGADENKLYYLFSSDGETWDETLKSLVASDAAVAPAGLLALGSEHVTLVARYADTAGVMHTRKSTDFGQSWA